MKPLHLLFVMFSLLVVSHSAPAAAANPVTFYVAPDDSGTAETPVTFTGYAGEKPILSGGRPISGWQKGEGGVWTGKIPQVQAGEWRFLQLFVDGSRRRPARSPNTGYYRIAELLPDPRAKPIARDKFVFAAGDLRPWSRLDDVRVVLMHSWETSIHPSNQVDRYRNKHRSVHRADE